MSANKNHGKIIVENFCRYDGLPHSLYESELGWQDADYQDAQSTDPETVFRYHVDTVGLNMAFYYVDDGCFYHIFTERLPIKVYRMLPNPTWDGKFLIDSVIGADDTHCKGEEIYSTPDAVHIWDELKIDGKPIGTVLERSVILELN